MANRNLSLFPHARITAGLARKRAREAGQTTYLTGMPCRRGHVAPRYVSNTRCIECQRTPDDLKRDAARHAKWRAADPVKAAEARKRDYRKHRAKRLAWLAVWREGHREEAKRATIQWHKDNPGMRRIHSSARRALVAKAEGRHTKDDVERLVTAQRGKCAYCRKPLGKRYHVDHVVPLAKGGTNWPANIQITCVKCNTRKNALDPIVFAQRRGFLL